MDKVLGKDAIIEIPKWAKSAKGNEIALYQSSENLDRPIILMGGIHGDEPEGVTLAYSTLKWLRSEKKATVPWIVIPCLNPDGSSSHERVNGNGVDLNRNYPSKNWSPHADKPRYAPGPSPGSEPEIKAIVKLIQATNPRLIIHCHSWQPCIVYTGHPAKSDAEALGRCSGYEVRTEIGYPTTGSLSQYGWHDHQIPIICIEEQEGTDLEKVWSHFKEGINFIFTNSSYRRSE